MVLDSNCQRDFCGNPLPSLYATWPTPRSDGVTLLLIVCLLDIIFMRFRRLYSLVHFWTHFWSRFSWWRHTCRAGSATEAVLVGDSSGSRCWPFAALQEGIYLRVAFSYPKLTSVASAQPTVGSLGFPKHFLEGVFYYFFSRFQGLGSLFSDVQHVYTQTTLTLTFVKLVVRVCRAPLKSLVCHARLWTIHGYLDVS